MLRLDKFIADASSATRSEARAIIKSGRVAVDGVTVTAPEYKLDAESACVCLDGKELQAQGFVYLMMNKPAGVLCATEDRSQRTVLDLLTPELRKCGVFPVGRLDKDTTGLLLLTNDGDFAHKVISPKSKVVKRYLAETDGIPDESDVLAFKEGIILSDGTRCLPAKLELLGGNSCIVSLMEGKYHQVKRMLAARGKPVVKLKRLSIGGLFLEDALCESEYRRINPSEKLCVFNEK